MSTQLVPHSPVPATAADAAAPMEQDPFLRAILDASSQVIYVKDTQGKYLFVNRQYEKLSGVPRAFIMGKCDEDLFPADVARLFREQDRQVVAHGKALEFEESVPLPSGVHSFITGKFPLREGDGPIYAVGGFCTDITMHKDVEEETLAAERERLVVTLRCVGEAIIGTDTLGRVVTMNPVAETLTGCLEATAAGRRLEEVVRPAPGSQDGAHLLVERALAQRRAALSADDLWTLSAAGTPLCVSAIAAPVLDRAGNLMGAVLTLRDVTEKRRQAAETFRAHNLQSIALLAGGIAHDFNNLLAVVLANATHLRTQCGSMRDAGEALDDVVKACEQASDLAGQLLSFARGGEPVRRSLDLRKLVANATQLVVTGTQLDTHVVLPGTLWPVHGEESQLVQVVTNLLLNAREAMPEGGTIHVQAENLLSRGDLPDLPAGRYVRLEVRDHGPGIPDDLVNHIFDPYFSTKGRGSGLGLAVVYAAVRRHGGRIQVDMPPGGGCRFSVVLPAAREAPSTQPAPPPVELRPRLSGRILVMDDEERVRSTLTRILTDGGHVVQPVGDGAAAVAAYRARLQDGRPFDAVVLDITIRGGMGGRRAASEILALDPAARLIVSSGYSEDALSWATPEHGIRAVVGKPYTADQMAHAVDRVLRMEEAERGC